MKNMMLSQFLGLANKIFIVVGLSFFCGLFNKDSLTLVLPYSVNTIIRFSVWGVSTILICVFWKTTFTAFIQNKLLFILTALAVLSFLWSDFPDYTLFNTRDVLMMTSFGLYFSTRFTLKQQVQLLALTLFIGGILSVLCAIGLPTVGIHSGEEHGGIWRGVYGHKNILGSMMVLSALTFLFLPKPHSDLYKWAGFCLSIALLVISTSRTALVILLLLLLIVIFYKNFKWKGNTSVIFTNILILILGCVSLAVFSYWTELLTGLGKDPTLTGRLPIWSHAISRLMERPLLGYGRDAFWAPGSKYAIESGHAIGSGWVTPHGHNGLVDLALDLGLIGVGIFLIVYFSTFVKILKQAYVNKKPEMIWLFAFFMFLAMNNVTESYLFRMCNLYWVLFIAVTVDVNNKNTG